MDSRNSIRLVWVCLLFSRTHSFSVSLCKSHWCLSSFPLFCFGFFQVCARRRAVLSVIDNPACPDKAAAERAVDEVWNSCFNDTRPFDEVSSLRSFSLIFIFSHLLPSSEMVSLLHWNRFQVSFIPYWRLCPFFFSLSHSNWNRSTKELKSSISPLSLAFL